MAPEANPRKTQLNMAAPDSAPSRGLKKVIPYRVQRVLTIEIIHQNKKQHSTMDPLRGQRSPLEGSVGLAAGGRPCSHRRCMYLQHSALL